MDPYVVLEVPKDADMATIRKAYRHKSKKVHPDGGGSPEQFAVIKLAVDVLSDGERRRHYDETGEIKGKEPDNELSKVMKFVSTAMDMVINKAYHNGAPEALLREDMIAKMVRHLREFDAEGAERLRDLQRSALLTADLSVRFRRKHKTDEPNRLEAMLAARARMIDDQMRAVKDDQATVIKALEFLTEYEFEFKPMPYEEKMSMLFGAIATSKRF